MADNIRHLIQSSPLVEGLTQWAVLKELASWANPEGVLDPISHDEIARVCHCSASTVKRVLRESKAAGIIDWPTGEGRKRTPTRFEPNAYAFNVKSLSASVGQIDLSKPKPVGQIDRDIYYSLSKDRVNNIVDGQEVNLTYGEESWQMKASKYFIEHVLGEEIDAARQSRWAEQFGKFSAYMSVDEVRELLKWLAGPSDDARFARENWIRSPRKLLALERKKPGQANEDRERIYKIIWRKMENEKRVNTRSSAPAIGTGVSLYGALREGRKGHDGGP